MPTQRPFFANFFSAFRARSTPGPFQAKSSTTTGAVISPSTLLTATAPAHLSTSSAAARIIPSNSKPDPSTQPTQTTSALPIKSATTSPFGQSTVVSGSPGTTFYRRPPSPGPLAKSPTAPHMTRGRQRRDSGSSNTSGGGGFMDAAGPEKWYVGGRTATGEERFYQLGVITGNDGKRVRSLDRLSL